jgi:hypothetical protein
MAFVPLSLLIPAWDDHYIPEVYAYIEKGLRRLQARYWLQAFALVSYVTSYNEDNYISKFRFELGVRSDREAAERACSRLLRARMLEAMVGVDAEWQIESDNYYEARELARFPPKIEMLCWETRGGAWDHLTVFVGLVALDPLHPFTSEDVGAIGRKHDLIPILRRMGGDPALAWMPCD